MIFDIKPWSPINAEVHSLKWTPMTTKTDYFYYILVNKYLYTLKITRFYLKWFLKYFAKLNHKIIKIPWQIAVILCICTWRLFINSKNGENVYLKEDFNEQTVLHVVTIESRNLIFKYNFKWFSKRDSLFLWYSYNVS